MAGPWEKYQPTAAAPAASGPWAKYGAAAGQAAPPQQAPQKAPVTSADVRKQVAETPTVWGLPQPSYDALEADAKVKGWPQAIFNKFAATAQEDAEKYGAFNPAYAAVKAGRDLAVGAAETAGLLGFDTAAEWAAKQPQLPAGGIGNGVLADTMQMGVPAGLAAKVATSIPAVANAAPVVKNLAGVIAAALSDFTTTASDEAATLGDFVGAPTAINRDPVTGENADPVWLAKAKQAIEGPALSAVMQPARYVAGKIGGAMRPVAAALGVPGAVQQEAADRVRGWGVEPGAVRPHDLSDPLSGKLDMTQPQPRILDEAAANTSGGYKPTTPDLVNSQAAQEDYRGLTGTVEGTPLRERVRANSAAVSGNLAGATEQVPGVTPGAATNQFQANRAAQTQPIEQQLTAQQQSRAAAEAELAAAQAAAVQARGTKGAASEDLARTVTEQRAADTSTKRALYDTAERNGTTAIDTQGLADTAAGIPASLFGADSKAGRFIGRVVGWGGTPTTATTQLPSWKQPIVTTTPGTPATITSGELVGALPEIAAARKQAFNAAAMSGDYSSARRLETLQRQMTDELNRLAQSGDAGAAHWVAANDYHRGVFTRKWVDNANQSGTTRTPVGAELRKADALGKSPGDTEVAGKFIRPDAPGGAREAYDDLERIVSGAPTEAAARDASRRYLIGLMADRLGDVGTVTAEGIEQFAREYGTVINRVGAGAEITAMAQRVRNGSNQAGALEQAIKSTQDRLAETGKTFDATPSGAWAGGKVGGTVEKAIADPAAMTDLITNAGRDRSGQALADLRNQVSARIQRDLINVGSPNTNAGNMPGAVTAEQRKASLAKMTDFLLNQENRQSLRSLFGASKVEQFDKVLKQLELMSRNKDVHGVAQNSSALDKTLAGTRAAAMLSTGAVRGGAVTNVIKVAAEMIFGGASKMNRLLVDAALDPVKAVELASKFPKKTDPSTRLVLDYIYSKLGGELTQN